MPWIRIRHAARKVALALVSARRSSVWLLCAVVGLLVRGGSVYAGSVEDFENGFRYQTAEGVDRDLEMAQRYYKRALEVDPDLFPALFNMAHIYYEKENVRQARVYFVKAAKSARKQSSKKNEALARNGLGICYHKEGKNAKAETEFRSAIRFDSSLVEAHYNLVNLLLEEKRVEEAEKGLERANSLAPSESYGIFRGRLEGKRSREAWEPVEIKIAAVGVVAGLFLYWIYIRVKRG